MVVDLLGIAIVIVGIVLFAAEIIHPGALLLIPGTILLVAGVLYLFFPSALLDSPFGLIAVILAAILATVVQLAYYRYIAPVHRPMTTTSAGLAGEQGVVVADVIPNTMRGKVRVKSEIWSARADRPIPAGTTVRIVSGEGVSILVAPLEDTAAL